MPFSLWVKHCPLAELLLMIVALRGDKDKTATGCKEHSKVRAGGVSGGRCAGWFEDRDTAEIFLV
jgi:hypothetical protein